MYILSSSASSLMNEWMDGWIITKHLEVHHAKPLELNVSTNKQRQSYIRRSSEQVRRLIFFFCWLKLSIITPMKRLRVKKDPKMMNMTKYMYM